MLFVNQQKKFTIRLNDFNCARESLYKYSFNDGNKDT